MCWRKWAKMYLIICWERKLTVSNSLRASVESMQKILAWPKVKNEFRQSECKIYTTRKGRLGERERGEEIHKPVTGFWLGLGTGCWCWQHENFIWNWIWKKRSISRGASRCSALYRRATTAAGCNWQLLLLSVRMKSLTQAGIRHPGQTDNWQAAGILSAGTRDWYSYDGHVAHNKTPNCRVGFNKIQCTH